MKQTILGQVPSKSNCYKVDNTTLIESYKRLGNVWKVGKEVGLCGQSVHERLTKLGVIKKINLWTQEDDDVLISEYKKFRDIGKLSNLANSLGRTKQFIARKAKALGLTNRDDHISMKPFGEAIGEKTKEYIEVHGHPRGFSNHHHENKAKALISQSSKRAWRNPDSIFNSEDFRQKRSDAMFAYRQKHTFHNGYTCRMKVSANVGGKDMIFKSSWEYEVAIRLQQLKDNGTIKGWEYEPKSFVFNDMRRGIRSYRPDFEIKKLDDSIFYIEVKGWKIDSGMKRISLFRKYYPNETLKVIYEREYKKIIRETDYLRRYCE